MIQFQRIKEIQDVLYPGKSFDQAYFGRILPFGSVVPVHRTAGEETAGAEETDRTNLALIQVCGGNNNRRTKK